ncbi:hypothetical protein DSCO28_18230 [Desulfosarcina ovata subsp. sediminis]|uniref:Uncharacterized protein n=1 Tax=Desulfosarcina ovata subsp. sediminis TaxID=885957 RepID=A0A5K7ZMB4_9BACT|nr:hypothetical protein [Desulfosarcina ovata]BBO81257.1 hypothetical protein DSCO28_18230 [Desulfosarcina ovata subsp. sediminis]
MVQWPRAKFNGGSGTGMKLCNIFMICEPERLQDHRFATLIKSALLVTQILKGQGDPQGQAQTIKLMVLGL